MGAMRWRMIGHRMTAVAFSCELGRLLPAPLDCYCSSTPAALPSAPVERERERERSRDHT